MLKVVQTVPLCATSRKWLLDLVERVLNNTGMYFNVHVTNDRWLKPSVLQANMLTNLSSMQSQNGQTAVLAQQTF